MAEIEIVQMWLPGRSADVTDPLLVLATGLLLAMWRERLSPEPAASSASARNGRRASVREGA